MHYFVRILYDSDSFHPKRQQGGGESGTSRYVVIRHDTIINEINTYDMSSNIKVERICEWCGKKFIAQTTVTRFCSKRCSERSYKERFRQKKMAVANQETAANATYNKWRDKDFLTPTQAAELLGIGRMSIYRYIRNGKIKVVRFERKTLISKADIQAMFDFLSPKESEPVEASEKKGKSISEFYTRAEIREKFGVKDSWIYKVVAENNVPKTILRGKAYFSKRHIDRLFSARKENPEITEWYSVEDIQEKYGMTLSAIYSLVSKIGIPKRKEAEGLLLQISFRCGERCQVSRGCRVYFSGRCHGEILSDARPALSLCQNIQDNQAPLRQVCKTERQGVRGVVQPRNPVIIR